MIYVREFIGKDHRYVTFIEYDGETSSIFAEVTYYLHSNWIVDMKKPKRFDSVERDNFASDEDYFEFLAFLETL